MNLILTDNLISDMLKMYPIADKIFKGYDSMDLEITFCMINTIWEEKYNLNFIERSNLIISIREFFSIANNKGGFNQNTAAFAIPNSWLDLYKYYLLVQKHIKQGYNIQDSGKFRLSLLEPHFILGILLFRNIAIKTGLSESEAWAHFYHIMKPILDALIGIQKKLSNGIVEESYYKKLTSVFNVSWYTENVNLYKRYNLNNDAYCEVLGSVYAPLYNELVEHLPRWRENEFLFNTSYA